jgi:hypothetical protein
MTEVLTRTSESSRKTHELSAPENLIPEARRHRRRWWMWTENLIPEARRHRRRRWMWTGAVLSVAALAVVLGVSLSALGGGGTPTQSSGVPRLLGPGKIEAPRLVFRQNPYMGISCSLPNSVACDRVGLAVWLRRPAVVTATIDGLALSLNDPTWSGADPTGRHPTFRYAGFLQPAELTTRMHVPPSSTLFVKWPLASPSVWFRIDFGHGNVVLTHKTVQLEPGWG